MVSVEGFEGGKTRVFSSGQFLFRVLGNFLFPSVLFVTCWGYYRCSIGFITVLFFFSSEPKE